MAILTDREGRNQPLFLDYYEYYSIATEDFSPTVDPSLTDEQIGIYEDKGFLVKPNADGALYGITLYHYLKNGKSLTGLVPQQYIGKDGQWIECRLIKVYAANDATYASIATAINVGITI